MSEFVGREHQQKTFVTFSRFLPLREWEGFEFESVKRKISDENLFSDNAERSSKSLWKMISADVKANVKQQKIKEIEAASYKFLWEVPTKLEMQCKKGMCFSFNFGLHSIQLDVIR